MKSLLATILLLALSFPAYSNTNIVQLFINTASCAAITAGGMGADEQSAQSLADANKAFDSAARVLADKIIAELPGWDELTYEQMYGKVVDSWLEQPAVAIQQMGELCMNVHHQFKTRPDDSMIIIPMEPKEQTPAEPVPPSLPSGQTI